MINQDVFMDTLRAVKEIIRTSAKPLTKEEMLGYFSEMELSDEQKNMVINYLCMPEEEIIIPSEETKEQIQNEQDKEPQAEYSKVFKMYMEEVESLKKYKPEELSMMYIKLLQGEKTVIEKISAAWMKTIVEMAQKECAGKYSLEDVVQEGNIGLFIKLTELNGSKEAVDVEETLREAVLEAMKNYISQIAGEDDNEKAVVGKVNLINEAIKFLQTPDGGKPSVKSIADYTGLDEEELSEILDIIEKADKK